jgi:hypothetical protein
VPLTQLSLMVGDGDGKERHLLGWTTGPRRGGHHEDQGILTQTGTLHQPRPYYPAPFPSNDPFPRGESLEVKGLALSRSLSLIFTGEWGGVARRARVCPDQGPA